MSVPHAQGTRTLSAAFVKPADEDVTHAEHCGSPTPVGKSTTPVRSASLANKTNVQTNTKSADPHPTDKLLAKLSGLHEFPQTTPWSHEAAHPALGDGKNSSPRSAPDQSPGLISNIRSARRSPCGVATSTEEILRLKLELAQAQSKINRLDQELTDTRMVSMSSGRVTPATGLTNPPSGAHGTSAIREPHPIHTTSTSIGPCGLQQTKADLWLNSIPDDGRSEMSDGLSHGGFNRARNIWGPSLPDRNGSTPQGIFPDGLAPAAGSWAPPRAISAGGSSHMQSMPGLYEHRHDGRTPEPSGLLRSGIERQTSSTFGMGGEAGFYGGNMTQGFDQNMGFSGSAQQQSLGGLATFPQYAPQGPSLSPSPHAAEFTPAMTASYPAESGIPEPQTYLPTTEPLNYRRMLDRNVTSDWNYIVGKIVCNNDQQASIFLQQKLKLGTPEQKYEVVEAIVAQAYPLMVNRFGNFLIQRCFEHGTPDQVIKIAEALRGNTLSLSMDPFGCHVVQKAFDSVPEDYKATMVHELLRRIPETVIHRYACHVWQKLFELRWTESPPQIMGHVNKALRGMWHEVALGETGSLVVQNIFENCLEDDKRPAIEEVLASIDIIAHGQFGNWCIQHVCEHGAPGDRSRAIDHVIRYAAEYSMDQFASKVVEKCLKIGGNDFLARYLDRVCEGRLDRPRIPLIDIASDQYGNYLIQYILTHATPQHREVVAAHIRKHMVSLRGSKFGSRVGMLCTNPAVATRPGPGVGPLVNNGRLPTGPRYGGAYR